MSREGVHAIISSTNLGDKIMAKKPDLTELAKKFDLNSIVGGIKSLLSQETETPQVDPSDAIGVKIAQLSLMTQQMAKTHEQLAKDFHSASQLLNELYKDLEALRNPPSEAPKSATEEKTEHHKAE
jgi:hypothetical protein